MLIYSKIVCVTILCSFISYNVCVPFEPKLVYILLMYYIRCSQFCLLYICIYVSIIIFIRDPYITKDLSSNLTIKLHNSSGACFGRRKNKS